MELFKGTLKGIKNSLKRFPQTIGISTICVLLLIYISEVGPNASNNFRETINKITMVVALGIPLSLCIKLYFERLTKYTRVLILATYLSNMILLIMYYYLLLKDLDMVSTSRYIGFSLILYLVFIFISYLPKRDDFEIFVVRIFTSFFTTILYSIVLYLGLTAIFFTIDKLLGVNIKSELYYYMGLIVAGIFAPSFFLAGLPAKDEMLTLNDYSKLLIVLVLYIIMPLISAYTIILYLYFGKVIITQQWPEGLVSNLVLWYAAISAAVLLFISPLQREKVWPRRFMKYFPKVILPLIVMMFISIGIRIRAYGVTENRYFVVALGLWVFLVMVYYAVTKKQRNIMLPLSLVVIIFITVFGPFSSYSVSKYSQNSRLNMVFVKNNMIASGKVIKASAKVTDEDAKQITSSLNYFDKNHRLSDIKGFPKDFKIDQMEKVIGVKYSDQNYENNNRYFHFNSTGASGAVDIRGYDYLFDSRNNGAQLQKDKPFSISYNNESSSLKISQGGKDIYNRDLQDFVNKLVDKYGINQKDTTISPEEMSFVDETNNVKIKIQFSNISGNVNNSNNKMESKDFEFYVIIKIK